MALRVTKHLDQSHADIKGMSLNQHLQVSTWESHRLSWACLRSVLFACHHHGVNCHSTRVPTGLSWCRHDRVQDDGTRAHQDSQPHHAVYHGHRHADGRHHDDPPLDYPPGALPTAILCRAIMVILICRKAQLSVRAGRLGALRSKRSHLLRRCWDACKGWEVPHDPALLYPLLAMQCFTDEPVTSCGQQVADSHACATSVCDGAISWVEADTWRLCRREQGRWSHGYRPT